MKIRVKCICLECPKVKHYQNEEFCDGVPYEEFGGLTLCEEKNNMIKLFNTYNETL